MHSSISHNLALVKESIKKAADHAGRDPKSITLVAVSKTKPVAQIEEAYDCDQHDFGESYVQEFAKKYHALREQPIQWHFVGHLQRNKAKDVVGKAKLIHTLDREGLALTIQKLAEEKKIVQDCLVQVKLAAEETKTGCDPKDLSHLFELLNGFENVRVLGLMTIGTLVDDLRVTRQEFKLLRQMRDDINHRGLYKHALTELSMGMSDDFRVAIEEGSTIIRVGTEIFGERK